VELLAAKSGKKRKPAPKPAKSKASPKVKKAA
jgi:hypothetical protein